MKLELYDSDRLNFVEFNINGDNENYARMDEGSKYLDAEIYNIFAGCFEKSNKLYDYYEPTKYNSRQIIPLRNALKDNYASLGKINTEEYFIDFIGQIFLGNNFILQIELQDKSWSKNWDYYVLKLKDINQGLIDLIDRCISDERILWVIGY